MLIFIYGYFNNRLPENDIICKSLGIRKGTLKQRIGELRRDGLILKIIPEDQENGLTERGMAEYERLMKNIVEMEIRPELHGVGRIFKLHSLLPLLKDSGTLMNLVRTVARKEKKNLLDLLSGHMNMGPSSGYRETVSELKKENVEISGSLDSSIRELTLIGSYPSKFIGLSSSISVNEAVLEAEFLRRCGRTRESLDLFWSILMADVMDSGCWICSIVGIIQCTKTVQGPEIALSLNDRILAESFIVPAHRSFLIKTRADLLSDMKRYDEADEAYRKALGISRAKKLVCLPGMIMNNIGVNHFRADEFFKAEKAWYSARRYCRSKDLHWTRVICEINLADIEGKKGNYRKAKILLKNAREFMEKVGDIEGLSGVYFNLALVNIEEGKHERAIYNFNKSEEFPVVYGNKREERRDVMRERFEEKGWIWENPVSL